MTFRYPDTEAQIAAKSAELAAAEAQKTAQLSARLATIKKITNTDYVWRGSNALLTPNAAWDNGQFTYLEYDHAGGLPVFFKVLADGSEARINYNVSPDDGRIIILHEVVQRMKARLNKEVIEIINTAFVQAPFNASGAGIIGAVRNEISPEPNSTESGFAQ